MPEPYDLIVRAGRVVCPATGLDDPGGVAIRAGRIVAAGPEARGAARETLDFPDGALLPGLVDLHAHPARGQSKYGVDPDEHLLTRGVTTVLSQGDAGADNWDDYRATVVEGSKTRVRMALNLARQGEADSRGCFERLEDADVDACVTAIQNGGESIWGIAVNTSAACCGESDPREILRRGLEVGERTGKPLLFGSRKGADVSLAEQLALLRAGDVLTYCFHPQPEGLVEDGHVRECVREARTRGVLFDVGHGMNSFSFDVAAAALADGFLPDTISTDQYVRHVGSDPQHDLPRTLSKLIAVGMSEADAFARVTSRPARILGLAGEAGALAPGREADVVVLEWNAEAAPLTDMLGEARPGGCWEPALTVRAGEVV